MGVILYFDDEKESHDTYGARLEKAGFCVEKVFTAKEFFAKRNDLKSVDAFVLDVMATVKPEDAAYLNLADTADGLETGLAMLRKLTEVQRGRTYVLSKRQLDRLHELFIPAGIPAERIFCKTSTSAREFAQMLKGKIGRQVPQ